MNVYHNTHKYIKKHSAALVTVCMAYILTSCSVDSYLECEEILNDEGQKFLHLNEDGVCEADTDEKCGSLGTNCHKSVSNGRCVNGECQTVCMDHAEIQDGMCV